ncbi:MAG: methyltransferase domain-containing protein [bacterium]|nr:methyltransferase domain-containing protein [bacterium]
MSNIKLNKNSKGTKAVELHEHVPADWYYESLRVDMFQRFWHKTRFREVIKVSEKAGKVLDIGCADGVFPEVIFDATKADSLIGIDVIKTSVEWAKKHWKKKKKMKFSVGDAQNLKFKANEFDAVYIMEVLEHVEDPLKVLLEIKRVLKRGGYGVFLIPSDNDLFKIVWWLWLHFYPRGWVWRETHIQTFRGNFLPSVCKKAGFKIELNRKFNLGMLHLVKVRKK